MNLFFLFLGIAAWQDLKTRSISRRLLAAGAAAGLIVCAGTERTAGDVALAMIPGIGMMFLSIFTGGMMGEGDGMFFIVSGLFLGWRDLLVLFLSGQMFCGVFGLTMAVSALWNQGKGTIRNLRLPFLPFLLPAALWMAVMRLL